MVQVISTAGEIRYANAETDGRKCKTRSLCGYANNRYNWDKNKWKAGLMNHIRTNIFHEDWKKYGNTHRNNDLNLNSKRNKGQGAGGGKRVPLLFH